jgi:hypothetical protein
VTDTKQELPLTREEQHLKEVYLDSCWERYCITGKPTDLAEFVRLGGNIDGQEKRDIIGRVIETAPFKNPGGAQPIKNIEFYLAVLKLMSFGERLAVTKDKGNDGITFHERVSRKKNLGKTAAIKRVSGKNNISESTGRDRYREGSKLLGH